MMLCKTSFVSALALFSATALASSPVPHHSCSASAYAAHDTALVNASKAFEADAAACYELLDAGHYMGVSLCLKAAESSRRESVKDADLALSLALATCEEAL